MTTGLVRTQLNLSEGTVNLTDISTRGNSVISNTSIPDGCIEVRYDDMDYASWDHPDKLISAEAEALVVRIKNNIVALMFLIGAPGNIINMAVFYKQGIGERVNLCLFALSLADAAFLTQVMFLFGEQLHMQFNPKSKFGPIAMFMTNHNFVGLFGFQWVSQILSAIIAIERCLCICSPLKFQTLMQTRTTAVIIITVYVLVIGLYFFVASRYRMACVYDSMSGTVFNDFVNSEFYETHQELINFLDNSVYGAGIPGVVVFVVITATIITTVKLQHVLAWRAGSSSSMSTISAHEVALTKTLIYNSLLFIACISPVGLFRVVCFFVPDINIGRRYHNLYLTGFYILQFVTYINSSFNIFVYYTMSSRYRQTFWSLCCKR